jgi:dolichyl-phosphate-mannose-protein mannosyltransferase
MPIMAKPKNRSAIAETSVDGSSRPTNTAVQRVVVKSEDYTSEGVKDHDVFLLPVSDYQVMLGLTLLAAVIRLFRIYQPSSVVFDEVQYVPPFQPHQHRG